MKNNKILPIILIGILVLGLLAYFISAKNKTALPIDSGTASSTSVIYNNADFGFAFSLPMSWNGYAIINNTWEGTALTATTTKQTGSKLLIRNPKWTAALPYEDIPVMVFTLAQWNSYHNGDFAVSAAPIEATELGRNNLYVFALPPRWDFDYSEGYAEAEDIIKSNPLTAFNKQVAGKLNIDVICQDALSYMKFTDMASADKFVADCKEGKHPEVIEKYKAQMNLNDGAVI